MKKIKMIDSLLVIWAVLFLFFIGFTGYYFYDVHKEKELVEKLAIQNTLEEEILYKKEEVDHPFVLDGTISDSTIFYAASYYYAIPKEIRSAFHEDGWQVVLTKQDISKTYYHGPIEGHLSGLADTQDKRIYISCKREDIRGAMVHEFGHYFDYSNKFVSASLEFEEIFNAEKGMLKEKWRKDNHNTSSPQEYFAESFAQMMLYSERLKNSCPQTYEYMKRLLEFI